MRLRIAHDFVFRFEPAGHTIIRTLRDTPRNFDSQHVSRWRIDVDQDCRLEAHEDAFGNLTHTFSVPGPVSLVSVKVEGVVETTDTAGVVRGTVERFPPGLYLRDTPETQPNAATRAMADRIGRTTTDVLDRLHALKSALHGDAAKAKGAEAPRPALGFVTAARIMGVPARCVRGYRFGSDTTGEQLFWAEAHVAGLGWVGFDPVNDSSPTDAYVRVAVGLDALSAGASRGAHAFGADLSITETVSVVSKGAHQGHDQ
jgi:transglutaminase-like putative cysteine protease